MLKLMRQKAGSWMIKALLLAVAATFVLLYGWGGSSLRRGRGPDERAAATVNGQPIPMQEFRSAYRQRYDAYRRLYRENFTEEVVKSLGIGREALDSLILLRLELAEAYRLGLGVSDAEVGAHIRAMKAFYVGGSYNKARYLELLRYNRIQPAEFWEAKRREILLGRLERFIKEGVHLTEQEWRTLFRRRGERVRVRYLRLESSLFENSLKVKPADVESFYEKNKEAFRTRPRLKAQYIFIDRKAFAGKVKVGEEDLKKFYDEHREDFREPERLRARHILLKLPPDASPEKEKELRRKAEEALAKIKAGADFAEVAREYSEGPSASRGGDLGSFARGEMDESFEKAAFALSPGEVSGPVRTPFGFHIIKVEAKEAGRVKKLEEVKELIEKKLFNERLGERLDQEAERAEELLQQGLPGGEKNLPPWFRQGVTDFFERGTPPADLPMREAFAEAAFRLQKEELSPPVVGKEGIYVLKVLERKEPYVPPLQEIRPQVRERLMKQRAGELAQAKGKEIIDELKAGKSLESLAASLGLKVEKTDLISRTSPLAQELEGGDFIQRAFSLKEGERGLARAGYNALVLELLERKLPSEEEFKKDGAEFRREVLEQKRDVFFRTYLEGLRRRATITINENLKEGL